MITRYPSEIIIDDPENRQVVAKVHMDDSGSATVTIEREMNARAWKEVSAQVLGALLDMRLEGDDRD